MLAKWLEDEIKPERKMTTYENYKYIIDTHITPEIGDESRHTLSQVKIQKFLNKKSKTPSKASKSKNPKPLSPSTVRRIRLILKASLTVAEQDEAIDKNPAALVKSPEIEKTKITTIDKDGIQKLIAIDTSKDQMQTIAKLIILTGLRRGEALGLKWSDVDFKE